MADDDCTLFMFVVWGVVITALCCFGFVGNLLSLFAFHRDKRSATTTLLQCLASSDFILLLSVFVTDSLPYICAYTTTCDNPWNTWPYIRYVWILTPVSHMCSIWFVVLIALNRFWAVCRPHDLSYRWNNTKTPIYVVAVLFLVISFNLPRFFEYKIINLDTGNSTYKLTEIKTEFGLQHSYKVAYKVMLVNILLILLPIVTLIVLTTLILRRLNANRRKLVNRSATLQNGKRAARKAAKNKGGSKAASEVTFVLVSVVVVAIVCQTPLAVFHFVRYTQRFRCGQFVFYLDNISKLLINFNSCINFTIYCLFSPKFRVLLLSALVCNRVTRTESSGKSTGKSEQTTCM